MNAALEWDYTALAPHYDRRAPYADAAIDTLLADLGLMRGARVADIGAGTGRLALPLAQRGLQVTAIEPNAAMRAVGAAKGLAYLDARGESTGLAAESCDLVCYGSSFNVLDAAAALAEARRILVPKGAIALLWNHRDLDDPLQQGIEAAIRAELPDFRYGSRREDPGPAIAADGGFEAVRSRRHAFVQRGRAVDFLAGFRAHATLIRQAGSALEIILERIGALLGDAEEVTVPFVTCVWHAHRRTPCRR